MDKLLSDMLKGSGPKPPLKAVGLSFVVPEIEDAFQRDYDKRVISHVQFSLIFGSVLYLLLGLQDPWFFPDSYVWVWVLRAVIAAGLLVCLGLIRRPFFADWTMVMLMLVTLIAGSGPIVMIWFGSQDVAASYYLGLVLIIVWAYIFSGLRFLGAALCNLILFFSYLSISIIADKLPLVWLLTNISNLLAISLLVGFAAYLAERQRRTLYYHAILLDVERRSQAHLAMSDHLTGLPNRNYFDQRLSEAMRRSQREHVLLALIFIDINDFKKINDGYGHQVGDEVLAVLAKGMEETLRSNDTVARLGGDEFVVLLEEVSDRAAAEQVASKLKEALSRAIVIRSPDGELVVRVGASAGVAIYPEDGQRSIDLMRRADKAMYQDKRLCARKAAEAQPEGAILLDDMLSD